MCFGRERSKNFWIKRILFVPIATAAGLFIFGSVVMLLWNALLPGILGAGTITFWQALGILVLSKILFGGFPGKHGRRGFHRHGYDIREKLSNLSPEEKEKFKKEWWDKFENKTKQL